MTTIAFKPYSSHPGDAHLTVVLRHSEGEEGFVTHVKNSQDGGYHHGHYFKDLTAALADFNERGNK